MTAQDLATAAFTRQFGRAAERVSFAPGRVNLIGDHVDYCDGLVLPMPLRQGTAIAWARMDGPQISVYAADYDEVHDFGPEDTGPLNGWRQYALGMLRILGVKGGLQMAIAGDLPRGSGLSSSASLCIALGRAAQSAGLAEPLTGTDLAKAAQRCEHEFAGVACGIMDQMASACGDQGRAMLLDCRNLDSTNIALPPDWTVLIIPSLVSRELVDGEYNARRQSCEEAAQVLGKSLRDCTPEDLACGPLAEITRRRAAHVVAEIARTRDAAAALKAKELPVFGALLNASHASLRDLFEVSHPRVDALVRLCQDYIGARGGARMTGGGFGGCVIAAIPQELGPDLAALIGREYARDAERAIIFLNGDANG